ncbi:hypothetical protein BpHYR1_001640, partial [Brachionus plicatilis]
RQDHFYFIVNDSLEWIKPIEKPYILIFHDESTFRSNEQSHSRWMKRDQYPFISKGKGKSLMVSDFLVAHCSCPFFYLNEDEWEKAIEKYPSLLESHGIKYEERTFTGSVVPGQDGYFDNKSILNQFERLFQMLEFKKEFNFPIKNEFE